MIKNARKEEGGSSLQLIDSRRLLIFAAVARRTRISMTRKKEKSFGVVALLHRAKFPRENWNFLTECKQKQYEIIC